MFKIIKRVFVIILSIIVLFALSVFLFIKTAPQMGQAPEGEHLELISQSPNFGESSFINAVPTSSAMDTGSVSELMSEWFFPDEDPNPTKPLPTQFTDLDPSADTTAMVVWYGHSTIFLKIDGKRILIDPVFGPSAAPISFFAKRFENTPSFGVEDIPDADIVVISHDHYDHLDYPTIKVLADREITFLVPLGVGSHMERWGISKDRIIEMDWWEETELEGLKFITAPARHFSGRSFSDNNSTLWASWIIQGSETKIYFSGDGGYSKFFKEIGEKYGPFDLAFMECGQYNYRWADIHMMPEETVQAAIDVKAKTMIPIHWGAFSLAPHTWIDPAERVYNEAERLGINLLTPQIGQRILVNYPSETSPWWRSLNQ